MRHRATIEIKKEPSELYREAIHKNKARLARRQQLLDSEAEAEWGQMFVPLPTFTAEEKIAMWKRINLIKFIKSLAP